jgi:hypothetical protein
MTRKNKGQGLSVLQTKVVQIIIPCQYKTRGFSLPGTFEPVKYALGRQYFIYLAVFTYFKQMNYEARNWAWNVFSRVSMTRF